MKLPVLTAALVIASSLALPAGACPDPSASSPTLLTRNEGSWSHSMRTVTIDGQAVRVTVSAYLISVTSQGSIATAGLTLETLDGAPLPKGLAAASIRMQRVNVPSRVVQRDLIRTDPQIEPDAEVANFGLERDFKTSIGGARFKTTVRLSIGDRTIAVPMGTIRVNTNTLVATDPVTQPDFTPSF